MNALKKKREEPLEKEPAADAQVLAVMQRTGRSLSQLAEGMLQYPQVLVNVKTAERFDPFEQPAICGTMQEVESALGSRGRVVLRASGTESVIRVMVEGEDRDEITHFASRLADSVRGAVD